MTPAFPPSCPGPVPAIHGFRLKHPRLPHKISKTGWPGHSPAMTPFDSPACRNALIVSAASCLKDRIGARPARLQGLPPGRDGRHPGGDRRARRGHAAAQGQPHPGGTRARTRPAQRDRRCAGGGGRLARQSVLLAAGAIVPRQACAKRARGRPGRAASSLPAQRFRNSGTAQSAAALGDPLAWRDRRPPRTARAGGAADPP